jgi:hypothetical protein
VEAVKAMRKNKCPVCGPVAPEISSRYCIDHLRELLAHCLEMPASRDWQEVPLTGGLSERLRPEPALEPVVVGRRAA